MQESIKWGIMSSAAIGTKHVLPAMIKSGRYSEVRAIASRSMEKARAAADELGIPDVFGSYEELLDSPEIQAVYIPLPNHLHREWMLKAMAKGKHVLCEKPLVLDPSEIKELIQARDKAGVKAAEAFMVHVHPQWIRAREIIDSGTLGRIRGMNCCFYYYNADPANIRNIAEYGGGAVRDIGCYPVHCSRFLLGRDPSSVTAVIRTDEVFKTDTWASVILDYDDVKCSFSVSTQTVNFQRFQVFGEKMNLEIEIPFNAPNDRPARIFLRTADILAEPSETLEFPFCDQYALQADHFSQAILNNSEVHVPLEDAFLNAAVLRAIFKSAEQKKTVIPDYDF
jgi:predicted dehydrogenase